MVHCVTFTGFLWSSSSSSATTSTSIATQFTSVISSSTSPSVSKSCDTNTVNKSSIIVTSQSSVAVNLSQLSHPKQGKHSKVTFSYTYIYIYIIQNTFGVKKARPSKVESYLEVNT